MCLKNPEASLASSGSSWKGCRTPPEVSDNLLNKVLQDDQVPFSDFLYDDIAGQIQSATRGRKRGSFKLFV
jgi:hypothetical protein